jgi:hypothetical protein
MSRPKILFLGYQPGGRSESDNQFERHSWPKASEYVTESWPLARNLREMFGIPLLNECVGLNAIFIRAPSIEQYQKATALAPGLRFEIENFCLPRVLRLIEAMDPEQIVAIGFPSLELFGAVRPVLTNRSGRVLVKAGYIGARPALGTLHLSGARISAIDRISIRQYLAS